MNALAKPAQFDRPSQQRRAMIAKVQIARKQLALEDDDYRQILFDEANGKTSSSDCTDAELVRVLERLKRQGFTPLPKPGQKRAAQHPLARKARALWISLHYLGVVHNPSEKALEAFACKQLGCEAFAWADQSKGYRLVEALKDMARRNGWRQTDAGGRPANVDTLQVNLCLAIEAKLKAAGEIPYDWTFETAALRLCGIERQAEGCWPTEHYSRVAKALGEKLRAAKGGAE